jgi:predicted HAD superfamily Cof-like phosphohydrolase
MNRLEKVKEFQTVFGHPVARKGSKIGYNRAKVRLALILEELDELSDGLGMKNTFQKMMIERLSCSDDLKAKLKISLSESDTFIVDNTKILDAEADLEVVLLGTVCETGHSDCFEDAFNDVHQSNMSKLCTSLEIALASVAKYHKQGIETEHRVIGDKYVIYNKETNKILKGIDYKPVDLSKYL